MLKFQIQNAEQYRELLKIADSGEFQYLKTACSLIPYPKYFIFFPEGNRVQGVAQGLYNNFCSYEEIGFAEFLQVIGVQVG